MHNTALQFYFEIPETGAPVLSMTRTAAPAARELAWTALYRWGTYICKKGERLGADEICQRMGRYLAQHPEKCNRMDIGPVCAALRVSLT